MLRSLDNLYKIITVFNNIITERKLTVEESLKKFYDKSRIEIFVLETEKKIDFTLSFTDDELAQIKKDLNLISLKKVRDPIYKKVSNYIIDVSGKEKSQIIREIQKII